MEGKIIMRKRIKEKSTRHLGRHLLVPTLVGIVITPVIAVLELLTIIELPITMALLYGTIPGVVFGGLVGVSIGGISYILNKQKLEAKEELTVDKAKSNEEEKGLIKDKKKEKREKKKTIRQAKKKIKQQESIRKQEKALPSLAENDKKIVKRVQNAFQEGRRQASNDSLEKRKISSQTIPKKETTALQPLSEDKNQSSIYRFDKNINPKKNKILFSDPYNQTAKMRSSVSRNLSINEEKIVTDVMNRLEKLERQLQEIQREVEMVNQQLAVSDSIKEKKQLRKVK